MKESDTSQTSNPGAGRRSLIVGIATSFGVGYLPKSPGTWGSFLGIPLAWAYQQMDGFGSQAGALAVAAVAGVPICAIAARRLGGCHDPGCIVLDEVVGMAATLFMFDAWRPLTIVLAFILFRFFDILKPTPVREVERLPHGWGIMADDLVAALYANLTLWLLVWLGGTFAPGFARLM